MTPEARTDLLHGLAHVVRTHAADPVAGGLEALRLIRLAGATWQDLLGPASIQMGDYQLSLATYGHRADLRAIGAMALRTVHVAPPFALARVAVLAGAEMWTQAGQDELMVLVRALLDLADKDAPLSAQEGTA